TTKPNIKCIVEYIEEEPVVIWTQNAHYIKADGESYQMRLQSMTPASALIKKSQR
ncbi:hypothetical protein HAX54_013971, partial [Datura stramonium]|nr:hypothetical protein [Datura stramonium]